MPPLINKSYPFASEPVISNVAFICTACIDLADVAVPAFISAADMIEYVVLELYNVPILHPPLPLFNVESYTNNAVYDAPNCVVDLVLAAFARKTGFAPRLFIFNVHPEADAVALFVNIQ